VNVLSSPGDPDLEIAESNAARREQIATRTVFFVAGVGMAAWAPLVPYVKARAGVDEGQLGVLLLCLGTGSIATMSLAGTLAARFGCRSAVIASTVPLCLTLPMLATASSPILIAVGLLVFGAALGALDVTMNIQAIIVERASKRSMMSGFHGLFSLGGIAGAGLMAALLGAGASPLAAALCVAAGIIIAVAAAASNLLPYGSKSEGPTFAFPRGVVLFIGALCFIAFLAEGAVLDWSAVFLTSVRDIEAAYAGLGFAAFSLTMTIGRLIGDRIVQRFGGGNVIVFSGFCAAVGFAIPILVPFWQTALLGYALVGAGCSNVVPVLYTGVGRQTVMPEHLAVPAITTLGYAGILIGPAAIGFVAHAACLSMAFLILTILQVGVAVSGRLLRV
jgi:predicted MFS family arabinose efflux permease